MDPHWQQKEGCLNTSFCFVQQFCSVKHCLIQAQGQGFRSLYFCQASSKLVMQQMCSVTPIVLILIFLMHHLALHTQSQTLYTTFVPQTSGCKCVGAQVLFYQSSLCTDIPNLVLKMHCMCLHEFIFCSLELFLI